MASGLQTNGPIKMSQIREEFLDDRNNNRLNEYGDGDSGLAPENRYTGTQRKFSDYYGRKFSIIKEVTNPGTQMPSDVSPRLEHDLHLLFTEAELQAPNDKVINIRDPGVPVGTTISQFGQKDWGVFQLNFSQITQTNNNQSANVTARNGRVNVVVNNYAKIWAPGGQQFGYYDQNTNTNKDGGNAFKVASLSASNQLSLRINNFGEVRAGGGAGAPGGQGGQGEFDGQITFGGIGGAGGPGRGYILDSPYYIENLNGSTGQNGQTLAGSGGTGGSGGDWGSAGSQGSKGTDGRAPDAFLPEGWTYAISIGAGGAGGQGENDGSAGGDTSITINGYTITGRGGGGGKYNSSAVTGTGGGTIDSGATTYNTPRVIRSGGDGAAASGDVGGGGGGAVGFGIGSPAHTDSAGDQGAYSDAGTTSPFNTIGSIIAAQIGTPNTNQNVGGQGGPAGSAALNNAGSDALKWGSGGGGAGYYGGDGGNGYIGGGGGGASGYPRSSMPAAFFMNINTPERWVRTKNGVNLNDAESVVFVIVAANGSWGEPPDGGEGIDLEYSTNGSTWTSIDYTDGGGGKPTNWLTKTVTLPSNARRTSTYLRYKQRSYSGANDVWAVGPMYVKKTDGSTTQVIDMGNSATYAYAGTIQFTSPSNFQPASGYSGRPPQLFWTGGKGGNGAAVLVFIGPNGTVLQTSVYAIAGSNTIAVPTGTVEIRAWAIGAGGGGGGAGEVDASAGTGGGAGGMIYSTWRDPVVGTSGANFTAETPSKTPGSPGKAVYFEGSARPVAWVFDNNGTLNGSAT